MPLSSRTHPSQDLSRYIPAIVWEGFAGGCRPRRGGWGSDEDGDDLRGDGDVDDVRLCPPHTTINLLEKEKGVLLDEETGGGGYCGRESSRAGQWCRQRGEDPDNRDGEREGAGEGDVADCRRRRRTAVASGGMGSKTTTTEAVVEALAVAGRADTGAATTVTTATMVTATAMTRLNVCDVSTEEKERPSNLSRMHATIK
jgi:hypothetical protein